MLGFLVLLLGVSGGLLIHLWGKKIAARERGLDERYENNKIKSLANGWKITLISIYIIFILMLFGLELSVATVLGILLLIHMGGWGFFNSRVLLVTNSGAI
ncbi:hypothetical protein [Bacillus sp. JJ722]|uniref:hypothetical protein n=1 Tax=Bacillus sp. JJ722 TaxID=3122973 RepID=UPI002FFEA68B